MTSLPILTSGSEILIVDDTITDLNRLADLLKGDGHILRTASSAPEALRSISARLPDLILTDVQIPGMDGFELCRRVKDSPGTADIPLIFVSALSSDKDRNAGFEAGAVDYIVKPFYAPEVLSRVKSHLALRRLQQELRSRQEHSEERFQSIYRTNMLAICFWREDGTITEANDAFRELLGYSREELAQGLLNWKAVTPPSDAALDRQAMESLKATGLCPPYEKNFLDRQGGLIPVLLGAALLRANPPEGVAYAVDLRPFKKLEERLRQAQKMESLGMLAGGIAHDFNNLLTGILGNASLIQMRDTCDEPTRLLASRIEQAADSAADLTRQMLAYAGKGRFVIQPVNLSHVVHEMVPLLEISLSKKARLQIDCLQNIPLIETDLSQIRQILMNLIINASEALGDNVGDIRISTGVFDADAEYLSHAHVATQATPGRYVFIEVTDTGCGMSETTLSKIFEPFFSTKFVGRGLGLSAIAGIVRTHQGGIVVTSQPGRGTTFRVLLPARAMTPKPLDAPRPHPTSVKGQGHVLVVDDEESIRTFAITALESAGYNVSVARDGQEAFYLLRDHNQPMDLVLLDMTLPVLNGKEVLGELRKVRPATPVILMSGHHRETLSEELADNPPNAYLQKPFKPTHLLEAVKDLLDKRG
jgi:PAS domain S-box-containing protein